jgi:hypothetical protein
LAVLLLVSLLFPVGSCGAGQAGRTPVDFGALPGGPSYAFVPEARPDVPEIIQPDGLRLVPVRIRPLVAEAYPEELKAEAVLPSPDANPAGLAWDGTHLWVAGRQAKRIYRVDPGSGAVRESFPAPGRFPTCLVWDDGRLWHTDARTRRLYGLVDGRVVSEFPLDWECVGVALAAGGLLVGDWQSDTLRVVSKETGKILKTVDAPDANLWGLASDNQYVWCGRGGRLIVHDLERCLPVGGFGVEGRHPDARRVSGLTLASESLWYADHRNGRLVKIRRPAHGQRIAARGAEREATFWMEVRNTGQEDWRPFTFLMNVPVYEMPGQRFLSYAIDPPPVGHYRDPDGNLHALYRRERVGPGDTLRITVRARLWSADRWTFVDPRQVAAPATDEPPPVPRADADRRLPLKEPAVRTFALKAAAGEANPYWRLRRVHDALIDRVTYAPPEGESVVDLLRTGKGLCRNLSEALQALGWIVDVPVLDAWAPHHNLVCAHLAGAGWVFVEVTANNAKESPNRWRRSIWFGGLPRDQLTTGVRGASILREATVDGVRLVNRWHCRIPAGLKGFSHKADWAVRDVHPPAKTP